MTDGNQIQIALGWNQINGAKPFNKLSPPLFEVYAGDILVGVEEWHVSESRLLAASKRYKKIGRPFAVLPLPYISECEFNWLRDNDFIVESGDCLVTVRLFDKFNHVWDWYNARLVYNEDYENLLDIYNLKLSFMELEAI